MEAGNHMSTAAASQVIDRALTDQDFASRLLNDPAATFSENGVDIPDNLRTQFNEDFSRIAPDLVNSLKDPARPAELSAAQIGCTVCRIAAAPIAAAIVAVGETGLATLTEASPVVIALARFAGASTSDSLAFIRTLGRDIAEGSAAVTERICQFTGACS